MVTRVGRALTCMVGAELFMGLMGLECFPPFPFVLYVFHFERSSMRYKEKSKRKSGLKREPFWSPQCL